ncbi:MAG: Wzz/FepE/Etk N-terminal domain-containing protein [Longimicrobiaceae bacterium]
MPPRDSVDLREVRAALSRGRGWIIGGALGGALLALFLLLVLPPRYEADTTVLIQEYTAPEAPGGSSRGSDGGGIPLGGLRDFFSLDGALETELEILASRSVAGAVVDSLALQGRILWPRGLPLDSVFAKVEFTRDPSDAVYRFTRTDAGYRVRGGGVTAAVAPGETVVLDGALVTLAARNLPSRFKLEVIDFQSAVDGLLDRLDAEQLAGDVAEVVYRGFDPVTTAAVANALVDHYLSRRKTSDRGINQYRYEFLAVHTDSVSRELALAESGLRAHQERSGVFDPELYGESRTLAAMELRAELELVEMEARALQEVVDRGQRGGLSARRLAGYPTLMQNPAINNLLSRLFELETQRTTLLDRRTENDPDVAVLGRNIEQLEGQLVSLANSYLQGLQEQATEARRQLASHQGALATLPARAEESFRRQREVERLAETLVALETQLVGARLAAIAEGGDVRQIDLAEVPEEPAFPSLPLLLGLGLFGGLLFGAAAALLTGLFGRRVRYPWQAELASGVPAVAFDPRAPLLLAGVNAVRGVLVVPVHPGCPVTPVANRLAATAALRQPGVVLAELDGSEQGDAGRALSPAGEGVDDDEATSVLPRGDGRGGEYLVYQPRNGAGAASAGNLLTGLEQRHTLTIGSLPALDSPATVSALAAHRSVVLVGRAGRLTRAEIQSAVEGLQRLDVTLAGVVLLPPRFGPFQDGADSGPT